MTEAQRPRGPRLWPLYIIAGLAVAAVVLGMQTQSRDTDSTMMLLGGIFLLGNLLWLRHHSAWVAIFFCGLGTATGWFYDREPETLLWLAVIAAAMDIGSYFAGRTIGGAKLWEAVSPKKTWAGFFGGTILVLLTAMVSMLWVDVTAD